MRQPERLVKAVFRLLAQRISAGEIDDVKSICPSHLRELWPEPVEAHCSHGRRACVDDDRGATNRVVGTAEHEHRRVEPMPAHHGWC